MKLPLVTLIDRLPCTVYGLSPDCSTLISRVKMLDGPELRHGVLYVADKPRGDVEFVDGSAVIFACEPTETSYPALFAGGKFTAPGLLNELIDIIATFQAFHEELYDLVHIKRNIGALIKKCSEILGNPAYLVDSSFKVLAIDENPLLSNLSAIWKNLVSTRYLSYDIVAGLRKSDELMLMESYRRAVLVEGSNYFNNPFINYNLRRDGKICGHFFVVGYTKQITSGDLAYANILGEMILLVMENDSSYTKSRGRDYENFFIHLLSGTLSDTIQIHRQLRPLGWELQGRYMLLRLEPPESDELLSEIMCSRLEEFNIGKPIIYEGGVVALFPLEPGASPKAIEHRVRAMISEHGWCGSISDPFHGFENVAIHYKLVCAALDLGRGSVEALLNFRDYAFTYLLSAAMETVNLRALCDDDILRLRHYDAEHDSNYFNTLKVYLQNERSITLAAEKLFVHKNTMLYRVSKLKELIEADLGSYEARERLLLSYRVLELLEKSPPG